MNVSTTSFSPEQMILAWTLILLLLSWFFIFTSLAIHDYLKRKVECEDMPVSTRPISIIHKLPQEKHEHIVETARNMSQHDLAYPEQPDEKISPFR